MSDQLSRVALPGYARTITVDRKSLVNSIGASYRYGNAGYPTSRDAHFPRIQVAIARLDTKQNPREDIWRHRISCQQHTIQFVQMLGVMRDQIPS